MYMYYWLFDDELYFELVTYNCECAIVSTDLIAISLYNYLAEGAQMLTRQVNYEIASLKRQISKCQQQQRVS